MININTHATFIAVYWYLRLMGEKGKKEIFPCAIRWLHWSTTSRCHGALYSQAYATMTLLTHWGWGKMDDIKLLWRDKVSDTCNPKFCKIRVTLHYWLPWLLTPKPNGCHFTDDIFNWNFLNENPSISIKTSLKYIPKGLIDNKPTLVQILSWRRTGDKPISEPMMSWIPYALLPCLDEFNALAMFGTWKWKTIGSIFNWQDLNSWVDIYGSPPPPPPPPPPRDSLIYWHPI